MSNIYSKALLTKQVELNIVYIGNNIHNTLQNKISSLYEGKCIEEGFVKKNSTKLLTFSAGLIQGNMVRFCVVFECLLCLPVEGMKVKCVVKNVTKAGIRAEIDEDPTPMVVFISRDHHYKSEMFANISDNDIIDVEIIGQRHELNDSYVSVIAELSDPSNKPIEAN